MNEWIKTSERLPKFSGYYLIAKKSSFTNRTGTMYYYSRSILYYSSENHLFTDHMYDDSTSGILPEYWMELPEPPVPNIYDLNNEYSSNYEH